MGQRAHGGFTAVLRAAGFDATGLELSPWIVEFAKRTFGIPMLLGPIERQTQLDRASFDGIILMDVLEHLPDPVTTLLCCVSLLKQNGILLIQTPHYIEEFSFEELVAAVEESSWIDEAVHAESSNGLRTVAINLTPVLPGAGMAAQR